LQPFFGHGTITNEEALDDDDELPAADEDALDDDELPVELVEGAAELLLAEVAEGAAELLAADEDALDDDELPVELAEGAVELLPVEPTTVPEMAEASGMLVSTAGLCFLPKSQ
jgi:hypothetical protein